MMTDNMQASSTSPLQGCSHQHLASSRMLNLAYKDEITAAGQAPSMRTLIMQTIYFECHTLSLTELTSLLMIMNVLRQQHDGWPMVSMPVLQIRDRNHSPGRGAVERLIRWPSKPQKHLRWMQLQSLLLQLEGDATLPSYESYRVSAPALLLPASVPAPSCPSPSIWLLPPSAATAAL